MLGLRYFLRNLQKNMYLSIYCVCARARVCERECMCGCECVNVCVCVSVCSAVTSYIIEKVNVTKQIIFNLYYKIIDMWEYIRFSCFSLILKY